MLKKMMRLITFIIIILCFIIYAERNFIAIETKRQPYLTNKKQVIALFNETQKAFNDLVAVMANVNRNILFQYNAAQSDEQFLSEIGDTNTANIVREIVVRTQMTNFQKYNDKIIVYQYAPIVYSDIQIGVLYNISSNEWFYYYKHDYDNCRHKNKFFYILYDLLFNRNGKMT